MLANGGYNVHPVPAPPSDIDPTNNKINEGGNNQNEILFKRGNAINYITIRLFIPYFSLLLMSLDYVILLTLQVGRSCPDYC